MIGSLSREARALLRSAKDDGPPRATRTEIWKALEATAAPPIAPSPATPAKTATTAGISMKAAFVGGILGSVLSAGVTLMLVGRPMNVRAGLATPPASTAVPAPSSPPLTLAPAPATETRPPVMRATPSTPPNTHVVSPDDSLSREATLVAGARMALLRGDAAQSLAALRSTRSLTVRQLEPEELSLEVRALRALDRPEEADAVETKLRHAYPDHALAK